MMERDELERERERDDWYGITVETSRREYVERVRKAETAEK